MGALDYLGAVKAPTRAIAEEVVEHLDSVGLDLPDYPAPYNGPVIWGFNSGGAEHGTGRALDFMVKAPGRVGDEIADYVWKHRERLGLIHMIWKRRIRSTRVDPGEWRYMGDRGSATENHMDHLHILFDGRDIGRAPKSSNSGGASRYYQPTGTDLSVKEIQKIVGVDADGYYGTDTKVAVKRLQKSLGVTADGLWGPATEKAYRAKNGGSKPSTSKPSSSGASAPKFPLPKGSYFGPRSGPKSSVSGYHSHRADLKKWQAQMKKRGWSITADGYYGPATAKVAKQFQREKKLGVDGLIGPATWKAAWEAKVT